MTQNSQQYLDFIDMRLNDPELEPWDGRSNRLDPGVYDFEVIKSEMDVSASGKPCMAVTFRVLSEGSVKGRTIRQKYPVDNENDASRRRMKSLIDALQPERDPEGRFAPASLTGLQMHAEVVDNTYTALDGRTGTNVERTSSKIVGEEPIMSAAPQQVQALQGRPVAQRRPAPTTAPVAPNGNNQQPQPMRR